MKKFETIDQIDDFHDQLALEYEQFRKKHPALQAWKLALPNYGNAIGVNPADAPGAPRCASADVEAAKVNEDKEDEEVSIAKTKCGAAFCNWFITVTFIFIMTILIYSGYLWPPFFFIIVSVILTCYIFERFFECMHRDYLARKKLTCMDMKLGEAQLRT
ncbi:hypothetical protein TKK_0006776 [Trichogramma kaykai]|uniref:Transmembrane protein n=1 Tax=Trichogramma kaykai TaxID=54128 RepID=A0ABD2XDN3_9HYME